MLNQTLSPPRVMIDIFSRHLAVVLAVFLISAPAFGALATDAIASTDRSGSSNSITSAAFSTKSGNELLLALAEHAIDAERLGLGDTPDLLTLSFSSNDAIGHCWGPDSQEVLDVIFADGSLWQFDPTGGHLMAASV